MKKLITGLVCMAELFVWAGQGYSATASQDYIQQQIIKQQEQERQYLENQRSILELKKEKSLKDRHEDAQEEQKTEETPPDFPDLEYREQEYKFDKIELFGNKKISSRRLEKNVIKQFIGKSINRENVSLLQSKISEYYIKRGYAGVKVYFDQKQIKVFENKETGKQETSFGVVIEEGLIDKIILEKNVKNKKEKSVSKFAQLRRNISLFSAFPFQTGKIFNINVFEQGLDQMNRLQSNSVTMEIRPSSSKISGSSDIIIINNQNSLEGGVLSGTRTTFLSASYNNGGSKSTGEQVINLSLNQDNLFSFNDNIYISYTENADSLFNLDRKESGVSYGQSHNYKDFDFFNNDDGKKRFSKALYGALSLPLGYWNFNLALNYSSYKSTAEGQNTIFHITGKTLIQTYSIERTILKKRAYKVNVGGAAEVNDTESYLRDVKSETGSARKSSLSLYLNNTLYTKFGTFMIKPSYQKGLNWFGAKSDSSVYPDGRMSDSDPKLQYDLLKMYLYFGTQFRVPFLASVKKAPIYYTLTMDGQYSFDSLYGSQQFSAGGQYTVRGFKESVISGDNGFYARNDLKISVFNFLPESISGAGFM
ncbi:MAG: hypothetical protein LBQ47_05820, partial [Endomicrobium sp.]|nr:hypothetical protein [Endomicrobium sp.]